MRFLVGLMLGFVVGFGYAQDQGDISHQPNGPYWFVDELLQWSPETDPQAKFNVSHVPLATRFVDTTTQIRPELSNDPKIMALMATHPTSNHPSQGFSSIKQYAFPYWQYIDYFIQWGGSALEGIVLTPVPTWTDAAHKNGVKSFGTVFFPPEVYGGKKEWVIAFLQKDADGHFPVADKLVEVAKYFKFDGWFINQETHGMGKKVARDMIDFVAYYQQISGDDIELVWYDAMITDGRVIWQQELNKHNLSYFQKGGKKMADHLFIDFKYQATNLEDSRDLAQEIGRSPWELFAGIDVQQRSYKSYAKWSSLYSNGQPYTTSIGLYWPNATFDVSETKAPEEVYENEQKFWNGGISLETPYGAAEWKGFSNYFPAAGLVDELPFTTNFNYGLGRFYNENGQRVSDREWHNLSIQDVLPTWQWNVDSTKVTVNYNFTESYTGGSCLEINSMSEGKIPLYKTKLSLEKPIHLTLQLKGAERVGARAYVLFSDGTEKQFPLSINSGWTKNSFKIPAKKGLAVVTVGLKTKAEGKIVVGELSLFHKRAEKLDKPRFSAEAVVTENSAALYLHIEPNSKALYHSIHALTPTGKKWLGKTTSPDYYISNVPVEKGYVTIAVTAISQDGSKGEPRIKKIKI